MSVSAGKCKPDCHSCHWIGFIGFPYSQKASIISFVGSLWGTCRDSYQCKSNWIGCVPSGACSRMLCLQLATGSRSGAGLALQVSSTLNTQARGDVAKEADTRSPHWPSMHRRHCHSIAHRGKHRPASDWLIRQECTSRSLLPVPSVKLGASNS